MTKDAFWIFAFCLPTVAVLTESLLPEHKTYVTDALSLNAFVIKTWTYRGVSLVVTVTKGNKTFLSEFIQGVSFMQQDNRLFIKYNNSREEVSLLLNNVTRDDEGLYPISSGIFQKAAKGFNLISKTRNVQLNVLEPSEIKQGYAGENILITDFLQESIFFPRLYHNDQLIAVLRGSDCDMSTNSPFHGRIRSSKDMENNPTRIEINNVTENDTGLYTVEAVGSLTQRCFLNITSTYTNSVSALTIVTPPDCFDENNSDQQSNITLSTTVLLGTAVNRASSHTDSDILYIIPIKTLAVFAIIVFIGSLIWIQRRNIKSLKAVCVPIYAIAVIIGAVGFIHLIGCLIWDQRRKTRITKAEQHIPQYYCDPGLYLTPISLEPPLTLPTCQERKTGHSNIDQNKTLDQSTRSIDMAQMLSKEGYEVVDISNNDDPQISPELEEIIYETTENCNTPYSDTSGYLTVLAGRETTV